MRTSCVSNSTNQQISNFIADEANLDSLKIILSAIQQICFSKQILSAILSCKKILLQESAA
jgi:hypothetical protein